ncbi:MAG: hypothetical protein LIQ31_04220 [Planctomycetes bacterium]|nr:hypothetical protein [Planctomycetota bacterium]
MLAIILLGNKIQGAYLQKSCVYSFTVFGSDSANALTFRNNWSEWDAGGAVAVAYARLYFRNHVTFENNYTGNHGDAITVYE